MSFSGFMMYTLFTAAVGTAGVEFGRKHPVDTWDVLFNKVYKGLDSLRNKAKRKTEKDKPVLDPVSAARENQSV